MSEFIAIVFMYLTGKTWSIFQLQQYFWTYTTYGISFQFRNWLTTTWKVPRV